MRTGKGKKIVFAVMVLILWAGLVCANDPAQSPGVKWYGSFKKIIQERDLGGVVPLKSALSGPHVYAVGMIQGAAGEITVVDDDVSLNYGKDGIGNAVTEIRKGEEASFLVTASVGKWRTIPVPENMSETELHAFILEEARRNGINARQPFPFLVVGTIKRLVWSVLDGTDQELSEQTHQLFFRKLVGYRAEAHALLVGFYPAGLQGELAWPGELWHVHVLFRDEKTTGHVNAFAVEKGTLLELPAKEMSSYTGGEKTDVNAVRRATPTSAH